MIQIDLPDEMLRALAASSPDGDASAAARDIIIRALQAEAESAGFEPIDRLIARRLRRRFITADDIGIATAGTRGDPAP